jgi:hypothetical protein
MKNAMILFGIWIGIILTAYGLVYLDGGGPTPAQIALVERVAQRTYVDSADRFQFEAPAGWLVREIEDGVRLVGPVERIEAWILALAGSTDEAISYACLLAHPCPGSDVVASEELEAPEGVRRKTRTTFATDDEGVSMYAIALETFHGTVVLFVRCEAGACEAREKELGGLEASLRVRDLSRLPGIPAMPVAVPAGIELQTDSIEIVAPEEPIDVSAPSVEPEGVQTEPATP